MKKKIETQTTNNTKKQNCEKLLKQTREKLIKNEEKFRDTLNNLNEAYFSTALDGSLLEHNQALNQILGFDVKKDLKGFHIPDLWENKQDRQEYLKKLLANDFISKYEIKAKTNQGKPITLLASAHLVRDELNRPQRIEGIFWDVTENKVTEDALKSSEEKYRLLAENITDAIFTIDMNLNYTYATPSTLNIIGYTADELMTMRVEQLVDAETLKWFAEMFAEEMEIEKQPHKDLKRSRVLEYQHICKDGSKVWVENKISFLRDKNDNAIGIIGIVRDITERKNAEEKLSFEGQRFQALADHSLDIIILMNTQGGVTYINPSVEKVLGYRVEERIGRNGLENVHPDDIESAVERFKILSTNMNSPVLQAEMRLCHKDGSWRIFETVGSNLVKDNAVETIIIRQRDITARKEAEEKLRREEQLFRSVTEQSTDIIVIANPEGKVTYENPAIEKALGYKVGERYGHSGFDLVHPDDFQKVMDAYKILFSDVHAPVQKGEVRFRHKDGSWRTFEVEGSNLVHDNVIEAAIINMHDITKRKKTEETLSQSEEKYRLLADHMKDQVWIMDLNLNVSYVSPSVEKILGYTFEELKKIPLNKLLTKESFQEAMDFFAKEMPVALAAAHDYILNRSLELEFYCKDGRSLWGESKFTFIRDENGKPISILGEGRNITERKQMEDALKKSEENFRRSLDNSPLGVRISTIEGKTLYANRAILDIYGFESVEELENTPLRERYTLDTYNEFLIRKQKRLRGEFGPSEYEVSIVTKSGEIRHLHVFRKEIFWSGQKQSQVIYEDITLRRQAEEKLNETLENLRQSIKITIQVLGTASEAKDPYMAGHQKRVANLARAIATEMKLPHDKIEAIRMASAIHDIGKISVPAEILCKPAILTELEFSLVKNHPGYSYDIIKEVESPWPLADIVPQHHERIAGSGYP
jgi:PAS domain S-box-containing protein